MRRVTKNLTTAGYAPLADQKQPSTSAESKNEWDKFLGKTSLKTALLEDQHNLCCYTEIRADEVGWGYHIEHIENKSQNPSRTFDPTNLAASALSSQDLQHLKKPIKKYAFGGHAVKKAKDVDMTLIVHCHIPDCSKFFAYLSNGDVVPALGLSAKEQARARYTINHLNLNSPVLQLLRKNWQTELEEAYKALKTDQKSVQQLINFYITPVNNKLKRFFTMSNQFFA
jgi:uncharacterized protein (TIGR02646 family)